MSLVDYIEKKRLERERAVRNKIRREKASTVAKIVAGAGIGVGLGILFAPKSGKETREDIVNKTKESLDYVSKNVNNTMQVVKEKGLELKDVVTEKYEEFSNRNMTEIVPEHIDELEEIIEEAKEKTSEFAKEIKEKIEE